MMILHREGCLFHEQTNVDMHMSNSLGIDISCLMGTIIGDHRGWVCLEKMLSHAQVYTQSSNHTL